MQTTLIRLKGVSFNNDSLPVMKDYKALVAADSSCVAAWRFDIADLIALDANNLIASVASWKDESTLLSFSTGTTKASLLKKDDGGTVALLPSGARYIAGAAVTINGTLPYTILVIAKPDSYATQMAIAGAPVGAGGANIRVESVGGASPLMRQVRGGAIPAVAVNNSAEHVAFIASFDGTTTKAINLFGVTATNATVVTSSAGLPFVLGSTAQFPFSGEVDFVALFNKDVTLDAELLANIKALAKMRLAKI